MGPTRLGSRWPQTGRSTVRQQGSPCPSTRSLPCPLAQVIVDIFRDPGLKGWSRALWVVALFIAPPLTALVYVLARGKGMAQRQHAGATEAREATDNYIRSVAAGADPSAQIARAKSLLDSGAINQTEYDQLKAKALA